MRTGGGRAGFCSVLIVIYSRQQEMNFPRKRTTIVRIDEQEQIGFFLCLVIGTLSAIKARALSPDIGIWALGRPHLRETLAQFSDVPPPLLKALSVADEFSALDIVNPEELGRLIDQLLDELEDALRQLPNAMWHVELRSED